ncbi:MAG: GNAT family N-acetyltransferase [Tannerellaceae bacterium]
MTQETTIRFITSAQSQDYAFFEQLLIDSFPKEEYRDLEIVRRFITEQASFHVLLLSSHNDKMGALSYWDFDTFVYVEHLAIRTDIRSKGYGSLLIEHLATLVQKPIVLEVELPENEQSQKRIAFYQRKAFTLCSTPYLQPPYCISLRLF